MNVDKYTLGVALFASLGTFLYVSQTSAKVASLGCADHTVVDRAMTPAL